MRVAVVASLTSKITAQSFAYRGRGTAESDKSCCYPWFVCHDKTLNQHCMLAQGFPVSLCNSLVSFSDLPNHPVNYVKNGKIMGLCKVKAAYIIINFVMNSTGPPRSWCGLDLCSFGMRVTPSVYLGLWHPWVKVWTKPRRLQLWKRASIPQVMPNMKELQPIATMHALSVTQ